MDSLQHLLDKMNSPEWKGQEHTPEELKALGAEVSQAVHNRRIANLEPDLRPPRENRRCGYRKKRTLYQDDPFEFLINGGMETIEYVIGAEAAEEAIRYEREFWLPRLERWLQDPRWQDEEIELEGIKWRIPVHEGLHKEIDRIKRCLGLRKEKTVEERRAETLARVKKHRKLKKELGERGMQIRNYLQWGIFRDIIGAAKEIEEERRNQRASAE
jgi:hypothetical protein